MAFIVPGPQPPGQVIAPDDAILAEIFASEGASTLNWEQATRCTCYTGDTHQPTWNCPKCGGGGVLYDSTPAQEIRGLFRSQSRWLSFRQEGELDRGEAQLTTPLSVMPGYTDRRVRDRFTIIAAAMDVGKQRVFYPAAPAVPFILGDMQRAWRVQLQSVSLAQHLGPR